MNDGQTLAWDIGGANLKAVHEQSVVKHHAFALWKYPDRLADEMIALAKAMPAATRWRLTMTGELCDCFATKRAGVIHILAAAETAAKAVSISSLNAWTPLKGFLSVSRHGPRNDGLERKPEAADVYLSGGGGGNWHALATAIAQRYPDESVLLIDTGSTTTDVLHLDHGKVACRGLNDPQRLASGELVYVGLKRTPLMGIAGRMKVQAVTYRLMNELFATMDDAALWRSVVGEHPDDRDTADGQPRTRHAAKRRLLRMIGGDEDLFGDAACDELAQGFWQAASGHLASAIEQVVSDRSIDRIILSGSGETLAQAAVRSVMPSAIAVDSLSVLLGAEISSAACAWALLQINGH